jgi:hypothetical protein
VFLLIDNNRKLTVLPVQELTNIMSVYTLEKGKRMPSLV